MIAVFYKIISWIMTIVFALFGYGSLIGGTPLTDVKVYNQSMGSFLEGKDENYRIFYTYDEWKFFVDDLTNPYMQEFANGYSKDVFEEHSLVLADIMLSSSDWSVKVCSAAQNVGTVEIDYLRVREALVGFQAICYNTIFVVADKYTSKVEFNELEEMEIPFMEEESVPCFYSVVDADSDEESAEFFGSETYYFTDFESWESFIHSGKWEFNAYADSVTEEYFDENNLALFIMSHGAGHQLRISQPDEKDNKFQIKYYSVSEPTIKPAIEDIDAVFVETGKNFENVEFINGGYISIPYMLDGTVSAIYW